MQISDTGRFLTWMYADRWDTGNKSELSGTKTCRVNPETEVNKERQSWGGLEEDAGKSSECHRMQAHMHALKQMSPKRAYHTPGDTHTYILQQRASSKRVASCRRSLREQNTTCPLIFSSRAKRGPLSNWSHLHILSHPRLNWSLSAIFFLFLFPPSVFVVPSHRSSFVFDLEAPDSVQLPQGLSSQKAFCIWYLKWRWWCLCCWQIAIWPARQRYVCVKQVTRSACLTLCVYISSLVHLSPLPAPRFAFA